MPDQEPTPVPEGTSASTVAVPLSAKSATVQAGRPGSSAPPVVGEADLGEGLGDVTARRPPPRQAQRQRHVLLGGQRRHQVERLEDEADPPPPPDGQLALPAQ